MARLKAASVSPPPSSGPNDRMSLPAPGERAAGADLSAEDWRAHDCEEARFEACTFTDVNFLETAARGAAFTKCTFLRCRFASADMRETSFEDCAFADKEAHSGPTFFVTDLSRASFTRCDLSFAVFERSDMQGLTLSHCNLRGARFHRADFLRTVSRKLVRAAATMTDCNFHLADLTDIKLPGADLQRSQFREADLTNADLEEADLREADLFGAIVAGAKLAGADLRGGEVSGVDLGALASFAGLKITLQQQYALLSAMGLDVRSE